MTADKRWRAVLALCCIVLAAAWPKTAQAQEGKEPEVAARVNGVVISREAVERAEALISDQQGRSSATPAVPEKQIGLRLALERLILEELLYQEAVARGIKVEKEKVRQVIHNLRDSMPSSEFSQLVVAHWAVKDEIVKTIERDLMVQELFKQEVLSKVKVGEEELRELYDTQKELFRTGPDVRLQQILLFGRTEEQMEGLRTKADEIAARARVGDDFVALARTYSRGPARDRGGDLGWRSIKHLPKNLRESVEGATVGETIGPVQIPGGLVIAKVLEKRQSSILDFEEVRDHLSQRIRENKLKTLRRDFLQELRSRAKIEVLLP